MNVQMVAAGPHDRECLLALTELYAYDLSAVASLDLGDDGRFHAIDVDALWTEPRRHGYLIRVDDRLAGFAMVHEFSRLTGDASVRDMAQFFVVKRYRRAGVGSRSARWLFDRFPGRWEVRQREENQAATAFWRQVIDQHTAGRFEDVSWNDERWRGPVQRFESAGGARD
jgi:predicted acetyltransferase